MDSQKAEDRIYALSVAVASMTAEKQRYIDVQLVLAVLREPCPGSLVEDLCSSDEIPNTVELSCRGDIEFSS